MDFGFTAAVGAVGVIAGATAAGIGTLSAATGAGSFAV